MNQFLSQCVIGIIKGYKYLISPLLHHSCRFEPTCSDYFIDAISLHGIINGSYLGLKRILRCHPVKLLGGGSGLDFVPSKKTPSKGGS